MRFRVTFKFGHSAVRKLLEVYPFLSNYIERTDEHTPNELSDTFLLICERQDMGLGNVADYAEYINTVFPSLLSYLATEVFIHTLAMHDQFPALAEGVIVKTNRDPVDAGLWFSINALMNARAFYPGHFNSGSVELLLGPKY